MALASRAMFDDDAVAFISASSARRRIRALRLDGPLKERIEAPTQEALVRGETRPDSKNCKPSGH